MLVQSLKTLFILFHAHLEVLFKLTLFGEDRSVVNLLDCFPLTCQLLLDVHNHVVSVPFASMLDILNEGVAHLANFDSTQDLCDLALLNSISTLLQLVELPLKDPFLGLRERQPLFCELLFVVDGLNSNLCLLQQALHL